MKKIHCTNCGIRIPINNDSCPVCHMKITVDQKKTVEQEKKKNSNKLVYKKKTPIYILTLIGIVIFLISFYSFKQVEVCTADGCGFKSLFFMGLGIVIIISSLITLLIHKNK